MSSPHSRLLLRVLIVVGLVTCIVAFFATGLHRALTLETLKNSQHYLAQLRHDSPWMLTAGFFAVYVVVTGLSVPGATILTLAAGAVFGVVAGTLIVSFASTLGALVAMLVARYVLRDTIQSRFASRLKAINEGVERDGAAYLFGLRLLPVFPFFVINLVMGLTNLPARTYYWVSQLGMLPATILYVNAGTQLAGIQSLSEVYSPTLLISFSLLALFPLIARFVVRRLAPRKAYKPWHKPKKFDCNLIVIGGGSGGLVSAYIAATVKARVTLIESHKMGGDCLNYGCVPSKTLIQAAKTAHQINRAAATGLLSEPAATVSFKAVMQRVQQAVARIAPHDSPERYNALGVDVIDGYARLQDPWTVSITLPDGATRNLTARSIIIATGAEPVVPSISGIEDSGFVTSDTVWARFSELDAPPPHLIVLGGGPIGCELAQAFARLGSQVTQIEAGHRLLSREDAEVAALVQASLETDGVDIRTDTKAVECLHDHSGKYLLIQRRDGQIERVPFDQLLCAVGRKARLTGYGLEELGIETNGTVQVNQYLETRYPNIYAVGDVAGPYQFTHMAAHQAWYACVNALFGGFKRYPVDYRIVPWATFVDPEVARLGLNEQEAADKGISVEVTRYKLDELDRAITDDTALGFVKVLTVPGKDRILGVTIVGAQAAELMAEFVLAMKHGLGLNKILGTIHIYPTMAEANKFVAGEWKRQHAPLRILAIMKRYHDWRRR
ncbi:FAD-dependent oxidoreductase [Allopusillimonas ginsengisoli]|uniref:FAD-dependent oxidoreductase n=1 Tax=Allopusillimonas ginsengisoli TaxID=453575 RepID=UPI00148537E7